VLEYLLESGKAKRAERNAQLAPKSESKTSEPAASEPVRIAELSL
jgi:hypothetical protein